MIPFAFLIHLRAQFACILYADVFHHLMLSLNFLFIDLFCFLYRLGCSKALGMSNGEINEHQLSATSSDPTLGPSEARPNGDAWCSKHNTIAQYLQVIYSEMSSLVRVFSVYFDGIVRDVY